MTAFDELSLLVEQIDEILAEGIEDEDDALELAKVAGLAERLGAPAEALEAALAWRNGPGAALLEEALGEVPIDALVEEVEDVAERPGSEEEVDEALSEFDDHVAAFVWAGQGAKVRAAARRVAQAIRLVPDAFEPLAPDGRAMARLAAVAADLDLYDYWFAVADGASDAEPR